jgi:hypothetical protein
LLARTITYTADANRYIYSQSQTHAPHNTYTPLQTSSITDRFCLPMNHQLSLIHTRTSPPPHSHTTTTLALLHSRPITISRRLPSPRDFTQTLALITTHTHAHKYIIDGRFLSINNVSKKAGRMVAVSYLWRSKCKDKSPHRLALVY